MLLCYVVVNGDLLCVEDLERRQLSNAAMVEMKQRGLGPKKMQQAA